MSATLNFNAKNYYSWKGNMFYQISSFIKKNKKNDNLTVKLAMRPLPLIIYRKDTIGSDLEKCSRRTAFKIDELDRPGSTTVSADPTNTNRNHLVNYKTNDITECTSINRESCIHMPDMDARRRVRSAGMVRRKYNESRNNDTYCTSSNQYLVSRNRTFTQNQYNFIRQGNASAKPGTALSKSNVYSPNGLSHCVQPYISVNDANNTFSYRWIDGDIYDVTIPDGQYDIYQLNNIFQNAMANNTHYFINNNNGSFNYLLNMSYDDLNKVVILETVSETYYFNNLNGIYSIENVTLNNWGNTSVPVHVSFIIPATKFQTIIGFSAGEYSQLTQSSVIPPRITQNYVTMNYKPNNPQFGQQGAVSSSTLVSRKRYDTITNVGAKMKAAYGSATANALAYGVSDHQYTMKDRIGFPLKQTPVINKYSGVITCVGNTR